jgi:hypothetical protein
MSMIQAAPSWRETSKPKEEVLESTTLTSRVLSPFLFFFFRFIFLTIEKYLLINEDWKYDAVPEIWDGKNVADFIDPEIEEKLLALEREEDELEAKGFYQSEEEMEDSDEEEIKNLASKIKEKKKVIITEHRLRKNTHKNKPLIPRKANTKVWTTPPPLFSPCNFLHLFCLFVCLFVFVIIIKIQNVTTGDFSEHLEEMGLDATQAVATTSSQTRKRARSLSRGDGDEESTAKRARSRSTSRIDLSLHDDKVRVPFTSPLISFFFSFFLSFLSRFLAFFFFFYFFFFFFLFFFFRGICRGKLQFRRSPETCKGHEISWPRPERVIAWFRTLSQNISLLEREPLERLTDANNNNNKI